jgi:hypothetical protein
MCTKITCNKIKSIIRLLQFCTLMFIILLQMGCKKLVEVNAPPTSTTSENVYSNDATAAAVITGIYTNMSSNSYRFVTGPASISVEAGLSSDELELYGANSNFNSDFVGFYTNNLTNSNSEPWTSFYSCLLPINTAIERLDNSNSLTPAVKKQLLGEAKFLRAFCFFYLINLYGDVPLTLTNDYRINSSIARSSRTKVYEQIIEDLLQAKAMLTESYVSNNVQSNTSDKIRPNKWAATALLARVYLFLGDWVKAEKESSLVVENNALYDLTSLDNVFLKNSKEAIWQLQPVNSDKITEDARLFILDSEPGDFKPVYLSSFLRNAFDSGDLRRKEWTMDTVFTSVSFTYPYKYRSSITQSSFTEYLMVLRLAEQYLIRSEARAQENNLSGAIADLDKIRQRAQLPLISMTNPGINKDNLLNAIMHERQVELFTEWGHRWLDLKRTGKLNSVMINVTPLKGGVWNANSALYPIPFYDLQKNTNLTQNPGY